MKNFRDDIKVNDLVQPYLEPIVEQMTTVFDPEIELDIYNLGLIYEITLDETGHCYFLMTLQILAAVAKRRCLTKLLKNSNQSMVSNLSRSRLLTRLSGR